MRRITEIAQSEASLLGADANVETLLQAYVVYNNPYISELVLESAKKVSSGIQKMPEKLSSEDFSHYFRKKPGVFIRLGTGNKKRTVLHFRTIMTF